MESSFFYGYLITQVPAGFFAAKFPANKYIQVVYKLLNSYYNF